MPWHCNAALQRGLLGGGYGTARAIVCTRLCLSQFHLMCLVLCVNWRGLSLPRVSQVDAQPAPEQNAGCWALCTGLNRELSAGVMVAGTPCGTAPLLCNGCTHVSAK